MSDRFKFRIWNKKDTRWLHDTKHAIHLLGETVICGEILNRGNDDYIKLSEINDLVIQQCTGLKDKNGNFIYEGDIIELDFRLCKHTTSRVEVVWIESDCMFGYRYNLGDFGNGDEIYTSSFNYIIENSNYNFDKIEKNKLCDRLEVVGNIYENKKGELE